MATWKKVIVSGSQAHLAAVTASAFLGGTFSGSSFTGNGSGLTNVTATPVFPTTAVTDVTSTDKFFISTSLGNAFITYSALLTDIAGTNLTAGSDDISLATTITGITSITSTGFTGSLLGTASWAASASQALTASFLPAGTYQITAATASNITPAISTIGANRVTTANADGTLTAQPNLTFNGTTLTVSGDLTVNGTTTTINTTNLTVTDQFILLGSGSTTNKDGGIIIQSAAGAGSGFAFAYDDTTDRWYFQDALASTGTSLGAISYTTTAAAVAVQRDAAANRPADGTGPLYGGTNGWGNMWIDSDGSNDIWIYV